VTFPNSSLPPKRQETDFTKMSNETVAIMIGQLVQNRFTGAQMSPQNVHAINHYVYQLIDVFVRQRLYDIEAVDRIYCKLGQGFQAAPLEHYPGVIWEALEEGYPSPKRRTTLRSDFLNEIAMSDNETAGGLIMEQLSTVELLAPASFSTQTKVHNILHDVAIVRGCLLPSYTHYRLKQSTVTSRVRTTVYHILDEMPNFRKKPRTEYSEENKPVPKRPLTKWAQMRDDFPVQAQLKRVIQPLSVPTRGNDAASKEYVDQQFVEHWIHPSKPENPQRGDMYFENGTLWGFDGDSWVVDGFVYEEGAKIVFK